METYLTHLRSLAQGKQINMAAMNDVAEYILKLEGKCRADRCFPDSNTAWHGFALHGFPKRYTKNELWKRLLALEKGEPLKYSSTRWMDDHGRIRFYRWCLYTHLQCLFEDNIFQNSAFHSPLP